MAPFDHGVQGSPSAAPPSPAVGGGRTSPPSQTVSDVALHGDAALVTLAILAPASLWGRHFMFLAPLPPLIIGQDWIERVKAEMPELPEAMRQRFTGDYGLPEYDSLVLTSSQAMANYYEAVVAKAGKENAKAAANWMMGDVSSTLNREGVELLDAPVSAAQLALLLKRIADGTISNKAAKEVFAAMWEAKSTDEALADTVIDQKGLKQISDTGALEAIVDEVLAANAKSVEQYRAGKEAAINALIGQTMKASKGKANPAQVTELLKKKLAG